MYLPCQTRRSGWAGLMVPPRSIMSVINGHLENNKMNKSVVIPCPPGLHSWGKQCFLSVRGQGWAATAQATERPDPVISGCQPRSSPLQALTEHPRSRLGAAEPPRMGLGRYGLSDAWTGKEPDRRTDWNLAARELLVCPRPLGHSATGAVGNRDRGGVQQASPWEGDLGTVRKLPALIYP